VLLSDICSNSEIWRWMIINGEDLEGCCPPVCNKYSGIERGWRMKMRETSERIAGLRLDPCTFRAQATIHVPVEHKLRSVYLSSINHDPCTCRAQGTIRVPVEHKPRSVYVSSTSHDPCTCRAQATMRVPVEHKPRSVYLSSTSHDPCTCRTQATIRADYSLL
jgi:hypothetical protein